MVWAKHPRAPYYLGGMSVAESVFFPIPVDVMLAPMVLAQREKAWLFAFIATATSVLGGILGYYLGYFAIDLVMPFIERVGYLHKYEEIVAWFEEQGIWIVFIAGFTPLPYKLITISAGALTMPVVPFILASCIGRGARFYLVSLLIYFGGRHIEAVLQKYVERIGWGVMLCIILFLVLR